MSERTTKSDDRDRRSSVRVRSLLPCGIRPIATEEIEALEARILDLAVVESDGVLHDHSDWSERTEDLNREMVFVLNEIRALRQQITEMQRLVEAQSTNPLIHRWVVINDKGLWVPAVDDDPELAVGDHVEVRLQIPSLNTPDILALGEVLRVSDEEDDSGFAVIFRYISQSHSRAILRYALRRERQLARSLRFH
jgi:hypothetical protein